MPPFNYPFHDPNRQIEVPRYSQEQTNGNHTEGAVEDENAGGT